MEEPKVEKPAYTPNFKFKANQKEHELPEFVRSIIKDAETEKHLTQIYAKAYGMDAIKGRYEEARGELTQVKTSYNSIMGQVQEAAQAYKQGDLDTVFETFKIQPEKVLQWAVEKVRLSQLPPEQRHAFEASENAKKQARMMEKQFHESNQQTMEQQTQYIGQMFELVLERPDISAVAQAYDTRKGTPGAFRELVIKVGESETALSGKLITPMEAAQKALDWLGEMPQKAQPAPAAAPIQQQSATPAVNTPQPSPKKTLPNLANAGAKPNSAPAKSKIRSLDDLKRKHDELAQQ